MNQKPAFHRRALPLLLAAAALPLAPLLAQENEASTEPPAEEVAPVDEAPTPTPTPTPATTTATPAAQTPVAEPAEPARTTRTTTTRTTARAVSRPAAPTAAAPPAPPLPPAMDEFGPRPAPALDAPMDTIEPDALPDTTEREVGAEQQGGSSIWPWLLAGLLAIGALALFALRRRRPERDRYEQVRERPAAAASPPAPEPAAPEPVVVAAPEPVMAAPPAFAAVESEPVEAPAAAAAAAPASNERPWLDLILRPMRAGVGDEEAIVEFELTVGNSGPMPARDVRISTWMLAAGSGQQSEMDRMLVEPPPVALLPEVTIDAGGGRRIEAAVALPRAGLGGAILPVVVADARYLLPDGSEGRTSAAYAVGVPDGGELAHFDVDNPSGLHEDVEARIQGEPRRS